jgi:ubiquinone/menaquinone biosynthesis C-methylase UbiE
MTTWILIPVIALILVLAYWEIWICEGTHLGRRFVVWLYDLSATRYDGIKQFDHQWERRFLGEPLSTVLGTLPDPRILDVGAGTGRLVHSVSQIPDFQHRIICLEPSAKMIGIGRARTPDAISTWVRGWAIPLPFASNSLDLVACLEILEFTPSPEATVTELTRVLRPGGWLLITNRIGREARFILGKTHPREAFPEMLQSRGLVDVEVFPWQMDYDLAWAKKAG